MDNKQDTVEVKVNKHQLVGLICNKDEIKEGFELVLTDEWTMWNYEKLYNLDIEELLKIYHER